MKIPNTYILEEYIRPYWNSTNILHESIMPLEGETRLKLLYPVDEIYSVMSSDMKTIYEEGIDYALENGEFSIPSGSRIPSIPLSEYYPAEHNTAVLRDFNCTVEGHPYLLFGEGDFFTLRQTVVSYRHSSKWNGRIPEKQEKFKHFIEKARSGKETTVVFYGDSITTGANSSGFVKREPFAQSWPEMTASAMRLYTGNHNVKYINTAVGGMDSVWGAENVGDRVISYKPDLLVLAFGMNDGGKTGAEYMKLTERIVAEVHNALPECDICLVSTMLPHFRAKGFYGHQEEYEPLLEEFAFPLPYAGVAPVTSVHKALLTRKEYYHITGNNINHPNDFLARAYAMTILRTIFGEI